MHLHFLRAIGTAISMRTSVAADAAAALLFRILSQPTLLFPPPRRTEGVDVQLEPLDNYISSYKKQLFSQVSITFNLNHLVILCIMVLRINVNSAS